MPSVIRGRSVSSPGHLVTGWQKCQFAFSWNLPHAKKLLEQFARELEGRKARALVRWAAFRPYPPPCHAGARDARGTPLLGGRGAGVRAGRGDRSATAPLRMGPAPFWDQLRQARHGRRFTAKVDGPDQEGDWDLSWP